MALNSKLTPEMEAALKKANLSDADIAKIMENKDVEKLGLDDLDGFSGGTATVTMNGVEVSAGEFNNMFIAMADSFGFDTALDIFKQFCGGLV